MQPRVKRVTESDLPKLKFLEACVKESLRLHPPVPLPIPRQASETCQVMNYTIPKNSQVLINVWALLDETRVTRKVHWCSRRDSSTQASILEVMTLDSCPLEEEGEFGPACLWLPSKFPWLLTLSSVPLIGFFHMEWTQTSWTWLRNMTSISGRKSL